MSAIPILPPAVQTYVSDYVARSRRHALLRAAGWAIVFFIVYTLLCCTTDRLLKLHAIFRCVLLIAGIVATVLIVWKPMRAWLSTSFDWVRSAEQIERDCPQFEQRLVTVASQAAGPAEYRGSPQLLDLLVQEVARITASLRSGARATSIRPVIQPFAAAIAAILVAGALLAVPGFHLPDLLARFFTPLAHHPPVTTTKLSVLPGDTSIRQSEPLRVIVSASGLPDEEGGPVLAVSYDNDRWTRHVMTRAEDGRYEFTLDVVQRDFQYTVAGGDARSQTYAVRVLRSPSAAKFSIRYTYPAYAARPPLTVASSEGLIEAPRGSEAQITVTATEPLKAALLKVGDKSVAMSRASDAADRTFTGTITVDADAAGVIEMTSGRDVGGTAKIRLKALPDQRPIVRLLQPVSEHLRLTPRDRLPLAIEALDDYGIESIAVKVRINGAEPVVVPVKVTGDARRQDKLFDLDFARLTIAVGDLATVQIEAKDRSGQEAASTVLPVLIAPRSIDAATHQRLTELGSAVSLADLVIDELQSAITGSEEQAKEAAGSPRGDRHLTTAAELAALVRQALLRAVVRSDSKEHSVALAGWIDDFQMLAATTEDLFREKPSLADSKSRLDRIILLAERARAARDGIRAVTDGQRAAWLLADRENLRAVQSIAAPDDRVAADRRRRLIRNAQRDLDRGVREVRLNPRDRKLDEKLRELVKAAEDRIATAAGVELVTPAAEWAERVVQNPGQSPAFDQRLTAAAQAEAVRPWGDLVFARDLHLAGRAAAAVALELSELPQKPSSKSQKARKARVEKVPAEFGPALAAIMRDRDLRGQPNRASAEDEKSVHDAAQQARSLLARFAGDEIAEAPADSGGSQASETGDIAYSTLESNRSRVESIALAASAEAARRNYDRVEQLDDALARQLAGRSYNSSKPLPPRIAEQRERIRVTMKSAQRIDTAGQQQGELVERIDSTGTAAAALAAEQAKVAEQIASLPEDAAGVSDPAKTFASLAEDPNWRSRATAAVILAQEQLAALPQRLAEARLAAWQWDSSVGRAEAARQDAENAPASRRAAANRAAAQADQDAADARRRLDEALKLVMPVSQAILQELQPYAPDTSAARELVVAQLSTNLSEWEHYLIAQDRAASDRAEAAVRTAIEEVQQELSAAQESLVERDPLVAAKWFARAAADSLSQNPPDFRNARQRQGDTAAALQRAWDKSIHQAAEYRMSSVPSFANVYALPAASVAGIDADPASAAASDLLVAPDSPAAKEWGRLRPAEASPFTSPLREAEPPGYEDALQKYFESLSEGKSQ